MPIPKEDAEALLNVALGFAEEQLAKYKEFYPFGVAMDPDGQIAMVATDFGSDAPNSQEVIDQLKEAFRSGASSGSYRATALVADVRITDPATNKKSDAVAVRIDHRDDYSIVVHMPYTFKWWKLATGELIFEQGSDEIFR